MQANVYALCTAICLNSICAFAQVSSPAVTQGNIQDTICQPGYSKTVRPPESYTNKYKRLLMERAGFPTSEIGSYALDHRLAIALGGAPRDPDNFQLMTQHDNSRKSRIEVKMLCYVCTGAMPLAQAQQELWDDWHGAYSRYASQKCKRR